MKNKNGFSLLEVLVGLVILSVGLLGMAALTTTSVHVNASANQLTEAFETAQAEMEKLRNVAWGTLSNGTAARESKGITYSTAWVVTSTGNVKDVVLSVTWPDSHRIDLQTKIAR